MRKRVATLIFGALIVGASCSDDGGPRTAGIPESPGSPEQEELATSLGYSSWALAENASSLYCALLADVEGETAFEAKVKELRDQRTLQSQFATLADEVEAIVSLTEQVCPQVSERITR
jgi:hypothetical protein